MTFPSDATNAPKVASSGNSEFGVEVEVEVEVGVGLALGIA
jgi:hypothetical protein